MPNASGRGGLAGVLAGAGPRGASAIWHRLTRLSLSRAWTQECEERRPFLWLPVAAGSGVFLYLAADREPVLWLPLLLLGLAALASVAARARPGPFGLSLTVLALIGGFVSAELRARAVATPMLDRIRIVKLTGTIEEVDLRPAGARFLLAVEEADGLDAAHRPRRVRLTTKRLGDFAAGDGVAVTARLLPPSRAALPGGYDFARDAYFSGIGAVGSALGRVLPVAAHRDDGWAADLHRAIDRARNDLALRVSSVVGGGDTGAIAAAMVTGKRDLLSADGREIIREAGIFHIITIAGVQMTLVAGLLFGLTRRLLALSPDLSLRRPIKAWAAIVAIVGAVAYDIGTGGRVGTQRALFMTVIMLTAVLVGRRAADHAQPCLRGARGHRHRARTGGRREFSTLLRGRFGADFRSGGTDAARAGGSLRRTGPKEARPAALAQPRRKGRAGRHAPAHRDGLRHTGDGLFHGVRVPRTQPLCLRRQSADARHD